MVQCQTFSNHINDDEDYKRNTNNNININININNKNTHHNNINVNDDHTFGKKAIESIIYKTGTCLMQCH